MLSAPLPVLLWDCSAADMCNCLKSTATFLDSKVASKLVANELIIMIQNIQDSAEVGHTGSATWAE